MFARFFCHTHRIGIASVGNGLDRSAASVVAYVSNGMVKTIPYRSGGMVVGDTPNISHPITTATHLTDALQKHII